MDERTRKRLIRWAVKDRIEDLKYVLKDLTDRSEIRLLQSYIADYEEILKEME